MKNNPKLLGLKDIISRIFFLFRFCVIKHLASELGFHENIIYNWKNGGSKPTVEQINRICHLFEVDESWIISGKTANFDAVVHAYLPLIREGRLDKPSYEMVFTFLICAHVSENKEQIERLMFLAGVYLAYALDESAPNPWMVIPEEDVENISPEEFYQQLKGFKAKEEIQKAIRDTYDGLKKDLIETKGRFDHIVSGSAGECCFSLAGADEVSGEHVNLASGLMSVVGYVAADDRGARVDLEGLNDIQHIPEGRYLVEVIGDSMEPIALSGQKLVIEPGEPKNGDMVVVTYENGNDETERRTLAKRWNKIGQKVILSCIAKPPLHQPIEIMHTKVISTYRIVGVWFE